MPNPIVMKTITCVHNFWYRATGGLIGGRFGRAPILLLTTTGRKSGRRHTTPLLYYPDDGNMAVIASNGGAERHPAWYLNLRHEPRVQVQVRARVLRVRAEVAGAEERARLWPLVTQMYPQYEGYQARTKRRIPVVILRPESQ